jgi:quinol monooxygenase YgiN
MKVRPECEARFLEILREVTSVVKSDEPDCRVYATWKTAEPHVYFMLESYRSEEGRGNHERLHAHVASEFFGLLAEPPVVEQLGELAVGHPD